MRLQDVDRAKGLAIFLVVYGHLIADEFPVGNQWYEITNKMVYAFHMPFFMFLSGLTTFYAYKSINSVSEYFTYTKKKFLRLAPAFFLFGIVILTGKLAVSKFLHVDNVPTDLLHEILLIAINPSLSVASSLWYIYVLFELLALFPLLLKIFRGDVRFLVALGLLLYFVHLTPLFLIDTVFKYLLFFSLGVAAVANFKSYLRIIDKYRVVFWMVFTASFLVLYFGVEKQTAKLIVGTCSIPALHALMRTKITEKMTFLTVWGSMSFAIYLMNTISIGFVKAVALKFTSWDNENFLVVAPILLTAGLYCPILIKRYVFPRIPVMNKITS
jgi:fucose 4-O-acetylase-like acetyltransferase